MHDFRSGRHSKSAPLSEVHIKNHFHVARRPPVTPRANVMKLKLEQVELSRQRRLAFAQYI